MIRSSKTIGMIIVTLSLLLVRGLGAQDKDAAPTDEQMKQWERLTSPNENHRALEPLLGKWKLRCETGGSTMEGSAEFTSEMGGRFLVERTKLNMPGETFQWMAIHGYDNQKQKYTFVSIDNGGTSVELLEGKREGNTITYSGELDEMGRRVHVRWIVQIHSKDRFTVEMYQGEREDAGEKVLAREGTR